ncbi:cytochrome P450 [Streptosporangium sp. NPDC000396]|uniref:cytochrome P450 n=1 Tax=Streptosporangium sp. NPDC000396 TaxID=3366185 RepID=UPI00367C4D84
MPSGQPARVAVRHADVKEVLSDLRFSRELCFEGAPRLVDGVDLAGMDPDLLLNMDPPRHTRIRRIVSGAFTPRRIESWRPRVCEIADQLIDRFPEGPVDLASRYSFPLPIQIICELLGVPGADRERFRVWSSIALSDSALNEEERLTMGAEFYSYIADFLAERRREPGDDLVDVLIGARDEDDSLSESELARLTLLLIVAGHETTATVLNKGVFMLLTEPDAYAALVADPSLVPVAVEEILRYCQPSDSALLRLATEDVSLPSGQVRKGEVVLPSVAAANLDPELFSDPGRFDILRQPNPHIGFGHGHHYCLGAGLARLELQAAIGTLVRRLPTLRLAGAPEDVPWRTAAIVRGPAELMVVT